MVRRSLQVGSVIAFSASLFGCFDVRAVDSIGDAGGSAGSSGANAPALLIDDFEDGNRVPSNLQFGPWRCYTFTDPEGSPPTCASSTPGYNSNYGFSVDFKLVDTKNGNLDYPGVQLVSLTTTPIDVSPYKNIVFSAKLARHDSDKPLPDPVYLGVSLGCQTIGRVEPSSGVFSIANAVQPTGSWQKFSLGLSTFAQAPWASAQQAIDARACTKRVDGLSFSYVLQYAEGDASVDGETIAATLSIDYVYLQ